MKKNWSLNTYLLPIIMCLLVACASKPVDDKRSENTPGPEQADNHKRAAIRMELAVSYYQQGQNKTALDETRLALQAMPDLVDAYSLRALIFMDTGENDLAEESFQRALKLNPNNSDVKNNYAWFLCQNGREKQSIVLFEQVLKDPAYPTQDKALNNAGLCSLKLKDVTAAERYFIQALRLDPGNPAVNTNLARVNYERGDFEKAHFYIFRGLKTDAPTAAALWMGIKIESKRGDQGAVNSLSAQLQRRFPNSIEYSNFQRGALNE